jgi:glycerol-3-phosphate dehydrogenase
LPDNRPVLILGAGINGAALARELVLGGVPVVVADRGDLSGGATACSSRLIHGGLRYLEYGEFDLVRESLIERGRLLRLAPQFVRPLRLRIPVSQRLGGFTPSLRRFLGLRSGASSARGLWLVRLGLWLYDWYARDPHLPRYTVERRGADAPIHPRFRWLCAYHDAQIRFPERFVVALFDDARRLADEQRIGFQLLTYQGIERVGTAVRVFAYRPNNGEAAREFQPAAIVNATGAWVDRTLDELQIIAAPLMGGTKGSHFISHHSGLRTAVQSGGFYTEAADGRPVFVLPLADAVLVGTTDLPYQGDPADAVATDEELDYLLAAVNDLLPEARLTRGDIDFSYCGVRPLPRTDASRPAAITRRHWMEEHSGTAVPTFSIVGGKLTTCRSLAESSARTLRARLGLPADAPTSRDRPLPGAQNYPSSAEAVERRCEELAAAHGATVAQVSAIWQLRGTDTESLLPLLAAEGWPNLDGTQLPLAFARWVVRHEWTRCLNDLVERRLMLLYHRGLTTACLRQLAQLLAEVKLILPEQIDAEVRTTSQHLATHFGKWLDVNACYSPIRSDSASSSP